MRRVWRHDMPRPSPPRVGAVAPRAAESADGNGAAVSHAQYVPTMTAAAVLPVGGAAPRTFAPGGIGNCTATAYTPYAVNDKSVATLRVVSIISRAVFLLYAYVCVHVYVSLLYHGCMCEINHRSASTRLILEFRYVYHSTTKIMPTNTAYYRSCSVTVLKFYVHYVLCFCFTNMVPRPINNITHAVSPTNWRGRGFDREGGIWRSDKITDR